jgi:hypothetical protein
MGILLLRPPPPPRAAAVGLVRSRGLSLLRCPEPPRTETVPGAADWWRRLVFHGSDLRHSQSGVNSCWSSAPERSVALRTLKAIIFTFSYTRF